MTGKSTSFGLKYGITNAKSARENRRNFFPGRGCGGPARVQIGVDKTVKFKPGLAVGKAIKFDFQPQKNAGARHSLCGARSDDKVAP
jgi:hypothetical protein